MSNTQACRSALEKVGRRLISTPSIHPLYWKPLQHCHPMCVACATTCSGSMQSGDGTPGRQQHDYSSCFFQENKQLTHSTKAHGNLLLRPYTWLNTILARDQRKFSIASIFNCNKEKNRESSRICFQFCLRTSSICFQFCLWTSTICILKHLNCSWS